MCQECSFLDRRGSPTYKEALEGVVIDSTFNWYWVVDALPLPKMLSAMNRDGSHVFSAVFSATSIVAVSPSKQCLQGERSPALANRMFILISSWRPVACAVNPVAVGPRCILICCVAHVPNITRYSASSLLAYQAHYCIGALFDSAHPLASPFGRFIG